MPVPPRVLLIDDHPVVRSGLALLLESSRDFVVAGEAGTVAEARTAVSELRPDLIVLDLMLGGRDCLDLVAELRDLHPAGRILAYTMQAEALYARRVLRAGAHGYLMKSAGLPVVREALGALARGERYVSAALAQALIDEGLGGPRATVDELSDRELQVLRLLAGGHELGEIASALNLSVKTIGTYRERLKSKLGVDTARELEAAARNLLRTCDAIVER
jgi:DNA-binding NarL/FixJ family response regulator